MGLYVVGQHVLPAAAQADLDRLHRETSHCEALFAYSSDQKKIFLAYSPVQHVQSATVAFLAAPGSIQNTCNDRRIYTYIYARGGGCVLTCSSILTDRLTVLQYNIKDLIADLSLKDLRYEKNWDFRFKST